MSKTKRKAVNKLFTHPPNLKIRLTPVVNQNSKIHLLALLELISFHFI